MTTEFKEIFDQQQQTIKDLAEQVSQRDATIAELKTQVTHQEPPREATAEEMNNLYK